MNSLVKAVFATLGAALLIAATPALGAEDAAPWRFELTPYIWGAGLDGSVRVDGRPQAGLAVEQSFSDILKALDFAAMGGFEARKERWGLLLDAVYFRIANEGMVSSRRGFASLAAQGALTQQLYSVAASYRAVEGRNPVDVIGGLRYSSVRWDVDVQASVPLLPVADRRLVETKDWVDPYVGARIQQALGGRWTAVGYADIGGFGVGSKLAWQALAAINYAFTPGIIGKVGYRYVSVDYDKSDFTYDMASSGAYLGVGFRW